MKERSLTVLKDLTQRVFALTLILVLLPLLTVISLVNAFYTNGNFLFTQSRVGKNNKIFSIYKFRTITHSSHRFWFTILRTTHLDELPQLYNILKGEMSFIGPRPETLEIINNQLLPHIPNFNLRHQVMPGITGWAQVNMIHDNSIFASREKLKYDLHYIKNKSLFFDMYIFVLTANLFFKFFFFSLKKPLKTS